jgi:hypothetical protein
VDHPPDDAAGPGRRQSDKLELPTEAPLWLAQALWRFEGRLRDQARGLGELRDSVHDLERFRDEMTRAEEIGEAVSAALERDRRIRFTFTRKVAAALAGAILLVPAVHDLVSWALS